MGGVRWIGRLGLTFSRRDMGGHLPGAAGVLARSLVVGCLLMVAVVEGPASPVGRGVAGLEFHAWPRELSLSATAGERPVIELVLANLRDTDMYVVRDFSLYPLELDPHAKVGMKATTAAGKPLTYTGPQHRERPLLPEDFVPLKAKRCYGNVVDLSPLYSQLRQRGSYVVRFRYQVFSRPGGMGKKPVWTGVSNEATCRITVR